MTVGYLGAAWLVCISVPPIPLPAATAPPMSYVGQMKAVVEPFYGILPEQQLGGRLVSQDGEWLLSLTVLWIVLCCSCWFVCGIVEFI